MKKVTFTAVFLLLFLFCIGCTASNEPAQAVFLDTVIKWPKSGLAKKLPEPEFGQLAGVTNAPDEFCAAFADISQEDLRDYVERVKKAGFTVDAAISDQEYMGIEMFSYSAVNKDGLIFTLTGAAGTCTITLTEP